MSQNKRIFRSFPKLDIAQFKLTSPATGLYNCVSWAANDDKRPWWPDADYQLYWPVKVPRKETVTAFVKAFETLGYSECASSEREIGIEKIAIYADEKGKPKHVARQLPDGNWTSKLGPHEDIQHGTPECLSDGEYGIPVRFMKRPIQEG